MSLCGSPLCTSTRCASSLHSVLETDWGNAISQWHSSLIDLFRQCTSALLWLPPQFRVLASPHLLPPDVGPVLI